MSDLVPSIAYPYEGESLTAKPDNVCAGNYYPVPTFIGPTHGKIVRHPEVVITWARELYMAVYDGSPAKVANHLLRGDDEHDAYPWLGKTPSRAVKMWAENGTTTDGVPWKVEMANALKVMAPSTQAKTALTIVQKAQDAPQVLWEVMNDENGEGILQWRSLARQWCDESYEKRRSVLVEAAKNSACKSGSYTRYRRLLLLT